MNEEEMKVIAEKIKNKTATENETILFINEFTRLVNEINAQLDNK